MKSLLVLSILCFGSSGFATEKKESGTPTAASSKEETKEEKASASDDNGVNCSSKGDQRKIFLVKEGSGCRVDYTKSGDTKSIGNQKAGVDFCEGLVEKVKTKLVASGFECE